MVNINTGQRERENLLTLNDDKSVYQHLPPCALIFQYVCSFTSSCQPPFEDILYAE